MDVVFEKKSAMTFIGCHTWIPYGQDQLSNPEFRDEEYHRVIQRLMEDAASSASGKQAMTDNSIGKYAISLQSKQGFFCWVAGLYQGGEVPEGFGLYFFPECTWAVFSEMGPLPQTMHALYDEVTEKWISTEGAKLHANRRTIVEMYSGGNPMSEDCRSEIWVPIHPEH